MDVSSSMGTEMDSIFYSYYGITVSFISIIVEKSKALKALALLICKKASPNVPKNNLNGNQVAPKWQFAGQNKEELKESVTEILHDRYGKDVTVEARTFM